MIFRKITSKQLPWAAKCSDNSTVEHMALWNSLVRGRSRRITVYVSLILGNSAGIQPGELPNL